MKWRLTFFTAALVIMAACFMLAPMVSPAPARAQATAEGVERLEKIFGDLLAHYTEIAAGSGATLVAEGDILVEPGDTYFAVTMPHLTLKQADGSYTDIGMIAVNALPGDTEDQWKMTVAMPTPIVHYDDKRNPVATVDIDAQNFAGIWHVKYRNFIRLNAQYSNVQIRHHTEQTRIVIPEMRMIYNLQKNDQNLWSGPATLVFSDTQIYSDRDGATARIGEIDVKSLIEDYSIEAALDYQEKISALGESYEKGETSISAPHALGLYNLVTDYLGNAWNKAEFDIALKDIVLTRPPIPGSPAGLIKIANARFGFDVGGFRTDSVNMGMEFGYDGLTIEPGTNEYEQTVPDHVNLDIRLNNLPWKDITELGRTSLKGAAEAPETMNMIGIQAAMMLPQLLTEAQTSLAMQGLSAGNDQYNIHSDVSLTADLKAVMGMTGNARIQIYGLDNLIENLNTAVADPNLGAAKKEKAQQALSALTVLKMAGQMDKDAEGRDIRVYNIEVTQQGQAMLNGTDIKALMQTMDDAP